MSLSFGLSPWLLALCVLAASGLALWTYRRTVPPVSTLHRLVLVGLRSTVLAIVLFLLFEPIWRSISESRRPPVLAVLIDDSQSMGLKAEVGDDSLDVRALTERTVTRLPIDRLDGQVRYYAFSSDVRPLPERNVLLDSLQFDGPRTNLSLALERVRDELQYENLSGVLVVTDGQYNTGRNPLYLAERYPVPIHTIVLGDTTRHRDVQIRRVTTNELAYLGTELPVQVGVRAEGYTGERVTVSLLRDGEPLSSKQVQLAPGNAETTVELLFTPEEEGLQQLTVAVTRLAGELTYRNNVETLTVRVLESKRRVLLLAAAPEPDVAAVRQLLQQDPNTEVVSYVQKDERSFYEGSFPDSLNEIDLFVLVGFPGRPAPPDVLQRVAAAAADEKPLLFLLTRQTDLGVLSEYFGDAMPVVPERIRTSFDEASFVLTPRGRQHPLLEIPGIPASLDRLPPLVYSQTRWRVSPDAQVLATVNVRGVDLDDPLLVVRRRSGSRSAALLGTGTWRWKNLPADLESYTTFWPTLFSNLVQWLTTPEDDRRVRVVPVRDLFAGSEPVEFTGQVYDESLNPVGDARLSVEITAPDNTVYPFLMEPAGNGRYVLEAGSFPEGTYRYDAEAVRNGVNLGTDTGTFAVGALTVEFKETQANAALLRQIARRSGGTFFFPSEVDRLPEVLRHSDTFSDASLQEVRESKLWQHPLFLVLAIVLLTLEWFLRKRSGMV